MRTSRPEGKLLFDAHHLGRRETGNETWTRNVVRCIGKAAAPGEIDYAVTADGRAEADRLTSASVHLVSGRSTRRLLVDLPLIARRVDAAALFVTYTMPPSSRPAVVMVHDVTPWHAGVTSWLPRRTRVGRRIVVGASCRRAAHLLVLSEATKRDLVGTLGIPADRVSVVGAAVDTDLADLLAAARHPARAGAGSFRVLAVGNVVPRKNLEVLAIAVRAAREAGATMELRVVGSVRQGNEALAKAIEGRLGPAVSFSGYVSLAELAAEYCAADVLCFPSMAEGFGLPVLEAMAAGVPVVVSDRGALPEVAGGAAIVCPADSPSSWLAALTRLHADPMVRADLRAQGCRRVEAFSWERTAGAVLHALRRVAYDGKASP